MPSRALLRNIATTVVDESTAFGAILSEPLVVSDVFTGGLVTRDLFLQLR